MYTCTVTVGWVNNTEANPLLLLCIPSHNSALTNWQNALVLYYWHVLQSELAIKFKSPTPIMTIQAEWQPMWYRPEWHWRCYSLLIIPIHPTGWRRKINYPSCRRCSKGPSGLSIYARCLIVCGYVVCSTAWSTLALAATWTRSMWTIDINESCPSELNDRTMNVLGLLSLERFSVNCDLVRGSYRKVAMSVCVCL